MTAWDDEFFDLSAGSGVTTSVAFLQNTSDTEKRGCTLVRTIIAITLMPNTPGAVSGVTRVRMGIQMVSDDSFAANAMADPQIAADSPVQGWLWRGHELVIDETLATGMPQFVQVNVDLRAQRKCDRSQAVLSVHNESLEGTAFTLRFVGMIRALYKLP